MNCPVITYLAPTSLRIRRQLGDQHRREPALQGVEVLLVLPERAAVHKRKHGDSRPGILAARLPGQPTDQPRHRRAYRYDSPTHIRSSVRESGACLLAPPALRRVRLAAAPLCAPPSAADRASGRRARARDGTTPAVSPSPPPPTPPPRPTSNAPSRGGPPAPPACTSRRG